MDAQPEFVRFGSVALVQPEGALRLLPWTAGEPAEPATTLLRFAEDLETAPALSVAVLSLRGSTSTPREVPLHWERVLAAWAGLRITTVGALDGELGASEVALAAVLDFRIAARDTVLSTYCCGVQPHCLHPRLAEVCGQVRSFELSPHHPIHAPEALMAGLVDDVVPPRQVLNEALRWAQRIAGREEATRIMAKLSIRARGHRQATGEDLASECPVPPKGDVAGTSTGIPPADPAEGD